MDSKYFLGVFEIDAQHEKIIGVVESLRAIAADGSRQQLIRPLLRDLHSLSVAHFALEESLMTCIDCDDLASHRKIHHDILNMLEEYLGGSAVVNDYEYLGNLIANRFLDHIVEHDLKMSDAVKQFLHDYQDAYRAIGHREPAGGERHLASPSPSSQPNDGSLMADVADR